MCVTLPASMALLSADLTEPDLLQLFPTPGKPSITSHVLSLASWRSSLLADIENLRTVLLIPKVSLGVKNTHVTYIPPKNQLL